MTGIKLKWLVSMQLLPAGTIIPSRCDPIDLVAADRAGLIWDEIDWRRAA